MAFSPDGRWLATGSSYTARLWRVSDLINTGGAVSSPDVSSIVLRDYFFDTLAFSPDGRWLATSGAQLWYLRPSDLVGQSCLMVGRNLTRAEWERYFLS
jgi:WD40 repeat protein